MDSCRIAKGGRSHDVVVLANESAKCFREAEIEHNLSCDDRSPKGQLLLVVTGLRLTPVFASRQKIINF